MECSQPTQKRQTRMTLGIKDVAWLAIALAAISGQLAVAQTTPTPQKYDSDSAAITVNDEKQDTDPDPGSSAVDPPSMFPHSNTSRFWISGQSNTIFQAHPAFHAKYNGTNSLRPRGEYKTSLLNTLFLGFQAGKYTDIIVDVESAAGRGIGDALGLAGFTDLDVVRNPNLGAAPYLARLMLHQIVPLSKETVESPRGPLSLATQLPARRLEFRIGKIGTADIFDVNTVGSDSHFQFLNWTVDNNGAYDYAADTRGYTWGAIAEFQDRNWGFRFGEFLMPKIANGIELVGNLRRAHSENFELELRRSLVPHRTGVIRFLTYLNHANMGVYRDAVKNFVAGLTPVPDITAHPFRTTMKYGFDINAEQEITPELRVFARWGWNEGQHESFAYTEVDQSVAFGGDFRGVRWNRKHDKVGLAFVSNGISADHIAYLKLGGLGFLLGDGTLNYGRENIVESYYTAHIWKGVFISPDLQHISHPGYNRDRGPVWVPSMRLHVEF
jgi:high affinity Mn2+ porin